MKRLRQLTGKVYKGEGLHGAEIWQCLHYSRARSQDICASALCGATTQHSLQISDEILTYYSGLIATVDVSCWLYMALAI